MSLLLFSCWWQWMDWNKTGHAKYWPTKHVTNYDLGGVVSNHWNDSCCLQWSATLLCWFGASKFENLAISKISPVKQNEFHCHTIWVHSIWQGSFGIMSSMDSGCIMQNIESNKLHGKLKPGMISQMHIHKLAEDWFQQCRIRNGGALCRTVRISPVEDFICLSLAVIFFHQILQSNTCLHPSAKLEKIANL